MDQSAPRARHRSTPPAHGGVREDCWSEGETGVLVEAWGERYVELKRGNLRQKDWQDVADAVNEHQNALGRPSRTDVQCKNRIDTLKKKFKIEKARRWPSQWRFFSRLEELIGPAAAAGPGSGSATLKKHQAPKSEPDRAPPQGQGLTLKVKNRSGSNPKPSTYRVNSPSGSSESSRGDSADGVDEDGDEYDGGDDYDRKVEDDEDEHDGRGLFPLGTMTVPKKRRWDGGLVDSGGGGGRVGGGSDDPFGELAKAITKFGEIYERVESSKQQQMMEMERQRMEFAKELEIQRMQMFMETQLELEKMRRPKHAPNNSKRS